MKSPILLATLFAGSLATVAQPGVGTPASVSCQIANGAIAGGVAVLRKLIPTSPHFEEAIKVGVSKFKYRINCGPAPDEFEALADDDLMDCHGVVDNGINAAAVMLRKGFGAFAPEGYDEGVTEGIEAFKKRLGCKPEVVDA